MPARYRELGVGAKALGFASSAYSLAQIVGGLALGALSDRSLGHRGLLLLSFVGAATAAIVGWPAATFYDARGVARRRRAVQADDDRASTALVADLLTRARAAERATWVGCRISSASRRLVARGAVREARTSTVSATRESPSAVRGRPLRRLLCRVVSDSSLRASPPQNDEAAEHVRPGRVARRRGHGGPARLAVAFAMRAAMVTRQLYELKEGPLAADYASFGLFKSITGIAASMGPRRPALAAVLPAAVTSTS